MVIGGNQTYHGGHFVMYRNIKSLCCIPGTTIVLQDTYTSKTNKQTNKQTHRKRDQIYGYQRCGVGCRGNLMKAVKRYKLQKMNKYQGSSVQNDKYN